MPNPPPTLDIGQPDAGPRPAATEPSFTRIVVPLDGSDLALAALPTARVLAERFNAELHTITVTNGGPKEVDRLLAVGAAMLETDVTEGRAAVVDGSDPARAIARRVEDLGGCLVCMSTNGRGRLRGGLLGSVTTDLLLHARAPIVAIGPMAERSPWVGTRFGRDPLAVPRLVACVDGSTASEEILPVARAWARALAMSLTVITVADDAPPPLRPDPARGPHATAGGPDRYIDRLVAECGGDHLGIDGQVVRDPIGAPSGIHAYLAREPAGLLALRTNARTGLEHMRIGATAAQIIRTSTIPCLVVPPPR